MDIPLDPAAIVEGAEAPVPPVLDPNDVRVYTSQHITELTTAFAASIEISVNSLRYDLQERSGRDKYKKNK